MNARRREAIETEEDDYTADREWAKKHFKQGRIDRRALRLISKRVPLQERGLFSKEAHVDTNRATPRARREDAPVPVVPASAATEYSTATVWIVGSLAAIGGGYLIGRLWKAHRLASAAKVRQTVQGDAGDLRTADLRGLDVLIGHQRPAFR